MLCSFCIEVRELGVPGLGISLTSLGFEPARLFVTSNLSGNGCEVEKKCPQ
jgi:hypothetical protein